MRVFQPHGGADRAGDQRRRDIADVPGIRYVVDSGLARISRYSHRTKVQRLRSRRSRSVGEPAGRPLRARRRGVCIRLFSEEDFRGGGFSRAGDSATNLASVILQMKSLKLGPVEEFPFVDPPDARMIRDGYETLEELAPSTRRGSLTKLDATWRSCRWTADRAALLAAATENCLSEVCDRLGPRMQDPRNEPMERQQRRRAQARFKHEQSDFLAYVNIWNAYHEGRPAEPR